MPWKEFGFVSDFYLVLSVILIAYMQAGHQLVAADERALVVFEKVKIKFC